VRRVGGGELLQPAFVLHPLVVVQVVGDGGHDDRHRVGVVEVAHDLGDAPISGGIEEQEIPIRASGVCTVPLSIRAACGSSGCDFMLKDRTTLKRPAPRCSTDLQEEAKAQGTISNELPDPVR